MKRLLWIALALGVTVGLAAAGYNAFSSRGAPPAPPALAGITPIAISSDALPPSACQSRLWGKVTNTATNLPPTNAAIEIVREGKSYKTITDPGGLYGFAGLCAGEYAMTLTPAGAGAIKNPNRVKLDGAASVKVDLPYR